MTTKRFDQWKGVQEFKTILDAMKDALEHEVPEDIAIAMANMQGFFDWFQVDNEINLDCQRIEAEYNRFEEKFEESTQRQWPMAVGKA